MRKEGGLCRTLHLPARTSLHSRHFEVITGTQALADDRPDVPLPLFFATFVSQPPP